MKQFLLSSFALLLAGIANTQQITSTWVQQLAGPNAQNARNLVVDNAGNSIACGWFEGVVDFDPGMLSAVSSAQGQRDAFVVKMNASGEYLWHFAIGSTQDDFAYDVDVDGVGNVYVTGEFRGTVNFNPAGSNTMTAFNGYNAFVMKISVNGEFQWVRKFGGTNSGYESGRAIDVDPAGNVVSTGIFYGTVDFNPGAAVNELNFSNGYGCYISKLSTNGDFVWAKGFPGGYTVPVEIKQDNGSNVFIVGTFYSSVDFDPGVASFNLVGQYYDTFITKLNSQGDFVWAKHFTTNNTCNTTEIEFDNAGNIYCVGHHNGTTDFNPDLVATENVTAPSGQWRPFLVKLNSLGLLQFVKQLSPNATGTAQGLEIDNAQHLYITGTFMGTSDFDPDPINEFPMTSTVTWTEDIYITRLDENSDFVTAVSFGGTSADLVSGLHVHPASSITTLFGTFSGTCDFAPGSDVLSLTANGGTDNYIARFVQCLPVEASLSVSGCGSAIVNDETYTASGEYTQSLTSFFGCDSTLTLNVTVNQPSFYDVILYTNDVISYNDIVYSQEGSFTQTLVNSVGCDSTIFIDVVILENDFDVVQNGNELSSPQEGASYQWIDCNNDFLPIPNATDIVFNPGQSGSYAVIVIGDAGTVTSDCIDFIFVSTEEISNEEITVFPNPVQRFAQVTGLNGVSTIRILNTYGQVVYNEVSTTKNNAIIDMEPLAAGIYIINISNEKSTSNITIIKN